MSYHAYGEEDGALPTAGDPGPLCTNPNQWKEASTCSIELCKTGYYWNGTGCIPVLINVDVDTPGFAEQVCLEAGLTWDPVAGCVNPPETGTGTHLPDDGGGGTPGGGGFTPGGGGTPTPSPFDPDVVAASIGGAKLPTWVWVGGAALALLAVAVAALSAREGE